MCNCHKKRDWTVTFSIDTDSLDAGWDGDTPLDPERNWTAYNITTSSRCVRCGDTDWHDSMGGTWASDDSEGMAYLRETVKDYGMLPRHVSFEDCEVLWEY